MPLVMLASMRRVIALPFGIPETYLSMVSSSSSFPSAASWRIAVPVKVFVTDPIRMCMSVLIGAFVVGSARPYAAVHVPSGVRTPTMAPGAAADLKDVCAASSSFATSGTGSVELVEAGVAGVATTLDTSGTHDVGAGGALVAGVALVDELFGAGVAVVDELDSLESELQAASTSAAANEATTIGMRRNRSSPGAPVINTR